MVATRHGWEANYAQLGWMARSDCFYCSTEPWRKHNRSKGLPTLTRDGTGRRITYRAVFVGSLLALLAACMLVLVALDAAGYRL